MQNSRHWISLRFRCRETEKYFVSSQSKQVLSNYFWISLLCVLTCALILSTVSYAKAADVEDLRVDRTKQFSVAVNITCMVAAVVSGILTKVPALHSRVGPEAREIAVVLGMMLLSIAPFTQSSYYGPKLLGYVPQDLWTPETQYSDTRMVLALSVLTMACHVTLPIRWIVLLPFEVFTVLVYAFFALILGGPDGAGAWTTLVLYLGLVICSAIGRRTIENHQRDALSQLIKERQLRAETEFKLTTLEENGPREDPPAHREDQVSTRDSRPETSPSALAFVSASQDSHFSDVIEVGKHEQWLIEPTEVKVLPDMVLGAGGYGAVIAGQYIGVPVAIKLMKESDVKRDLLASSLNEIRVLRRLRHPCIVSFFGACLDIEEGSTAIILEWVHGPCLERFVLQGGLPNRPLRPADQFSAVKDTCSAVCYLHSRQPSIVHGDLKGTNIIMERNPCCPDGLRAKLLDFGLSRALTRHSGRMGGTPMWIAPEVIQNPNWPAHTSSDTFSFGRLAFFVLTGIFPFRNIHNRKQILKILNSGSIPALPWPLTTSRLIEDWRWWVEACSDCDPLKRPCMEDVTTVITETMQKFEEYEEESGSKEVSEAADNIGHAPEETQLPASMAGGECGGPGRLRL